MLTERNLDTTKWPKMDITNCRSMELLRRLGVHEGLREVGTRFNCLSSYQRNQVRTWNRADHFSS